MPGLWVKSHLVYIITIIMIIIITTNTNTIISNDYCYYQYFCYRCTLIIHYLISYYMLLKFQCLEVTRNCTLSETVMVTEFNTTFSGWWLHHVAERWKNNVLRTISVPVIRELNNSDVSPHHIYEYIYIYIYIYMPELLVHSWTQHNEGWCAGWSAHSAS